MIMDTKYTPPLTMFDYAALGMLGLVGLFLLKLLCSLMRKVYLKYQARKDRSYNTFDKPDLNQMEKQAMKTWKFDLPPELETDV